MKQSVYTKNQFEVYLSEPKISYCWIGIVLLQTSSLEHFNPSTDMLLHSFRFHQSNLMSHYDSGLQTMDCDPQAVRVQVGGKKREIKELVEIGIFNFY
jgi:hypothetical protein